MKFVSWNVNGLRSCLNKGFMDFFLAEQPDICCIQETKLQPGQADVARSDWKYGNGKLKNPQKADRTRITRRGLCILCIFSMVYDALPA